MKTLLGSEVTANLPTPYVNHFCGLIEQGKFDSELAVASLAAGALPVVPSSEQEIMRNRQPGLSALKLYRGQKWVVSEILKTLLPVFEFYTFEISAAGLQQVARVILKGFYTLTLPDLQLCFEKGMCGQYGKLYPSFRSSTVVDWLTEYRENRSLIAEQIQADKTVSLPMPFKFMDSETRKVYLHRLGEGIKQLDALIERKGYGRQGLHSGKPGRSYSNLHAAIEANEENPAEYMAALIEEWSIEYDRLTEEKPEMMKEIPIRIFLRTKAQEMLVEYNKQMAH